MNDERLPGTDGATAEGRPATMHLAPAPAVIPPQAERDEQLLALWLFDRPEETRRAYAGDVRGFLAHTGKPIRATTLGDVQGFVSILAGLASASRGRKLSAVRCASVRPPACAGATTPASSPCSAKEPRPAPRCCRAPRGSCSPNCAARPPRTRRCSAPAAAGLTLCKFTASSRPRPSAPACRRRCRRTGCTTPAPATRSTAPRRSYLVQATLRSPRPGDTCVPGRPTAWQSTWRDDCSNALHDDALQLLPRGRHRQVAAPSFKVAQSSRAKDVRSTGSNRWFDHPAYDAALTGTLTIERMLLLNQLPYRSTSIVSREKSWSGTMLADLQGA